MPILSLELNIPRPPAGCWSAKTIIVKSVPAENDLLRPAGNKYASFGFDVLQTTYRL